MSKRISKEVKIFWDMVISDVTAPERLDELPYFIRRLMVWLRENNIDLFVKINRQVQWIAKGHKLGPKVLDRMEVSLMSNPLLAPRVVADHACSFFKINPVMRPLVLKEARKIKKRIMMRKRRLILRDPSQKEKIKKEIVKDCANCPLIKYLGLEGILFLTHSPNRT